MNATIDAAFSQIRLSALGFATMNLVRTPISSLSVGIALIGDKSALVPGYLLINYSRKLPAAGLELFIDIPQRVAIRKELTNKTFITAGSELGGTMFFFSLKEPNLPTNAISTALNIKSGLTVEHMVSRNVIVGLSAGVMSTPMTKALGSRSRQSDYLIKTKTGNAPYVNFSISVLPFWRGLRR